MGSARWSSWRNRDGTPSTTATSGTRAGSSDIASLALGNARRLSELERFHELVESLDAVFWEADATTMAFTFLGGRLDDILGAEAAGWPNQGVTWGSHIAAADRKWRSRRVAPPSKRVRTTASSTG